MQDNQGFGKLGEEAADRDKYSKEGERRGESKQ